MTTRVGPYPPRIGVSDECLRHISKQLFSVRYRYVADPMFPGWTFKDPTHVDLTVLRYDDQAGNFWLYTVTDDRSHDGYYRIAEWKD